MSRRVLEEPDRARLITKIICSQKIVVRASSAVEKRVTGCTAARASNAYLLLVVKITWKGDASRSGVIENSQIFRVAREATSIIVTSIAIVWAFVTH